MHNEPIDKFEVALGESPFFNGNFKVGEENATEDEACDKAVKYAQSLVERGYQPEDIVIIEWSGDNPIEIRHHQEFL
jgi:hypothetical protein